MGLSERSPQEAQDIADLVYQETHQPPHYPLIVVEPVPTFHQVDTLQVEPDVNWGKIDRIFD